MGLGCLPSKPATATVSSRDTEQDAEIAKVKSAITTLDEGKASKTALTDLSDRVSKINQGTAPDLSQYYTKSQVDTAVSTAVNNAITALKNDKPWNTSSGGSTGGTSQTGTVSFATTPAAIPQVYSAATGGGQSVFYTMKIVNSSGSWQYVKPIITLNVQSSYSSRAVTGITVTMSAGSCSMTGSKTVADAATSSVGNFSISPNVGNGATSTSSLTIIPISGCNGTGEFQIGSNQSMDILIQISGLTTSDVTLWNVTNSISSRGL
jgi:hypothetical protein